MPALTQQDRARRLARRTGRLSAGDAVAAGIHRQALTRLVQNGLLQRVARGLYRVPDHPVTEHHGLALVAAAVPHAVICLLSALAFHGIGGQLPAEVWVALDRRARRPALRYPPLHVVRFGGLARTEGVVRHHVDGQDVRVYCVAKTIADCFKYRNKIGLEVALEALREGWRARRFGMDELDRYARICRVERVMRPYLEALVG